MRGAPFPCEGERVMTADERSPKPRFFFVRIFYNDYYAEELFTNI